MYANTKKELFLGKKTFEAQKLTPDELMDKMVKCIYNNVEIEDGYVDNGLRVSDIETIFCVLRDLIERENDGDSTKIGKILVKDLPVDGAQLVGAAYDDDDWLEVITLSNGFTYLKVLSTLGDDSLVPVYTVLYIGADDMIHGFIPMCGNNVFAETNFQLGTIEGSDAEAWNALLTEYGVKCDTRNTFDYGRTCFETYAKKYGVESTPNDANYEDDEYVETMLELNLNYIVEDIISNVTLI